MNLKFNRIFISFFLCGLISLTNLSSLSSLSSAKAGELEIYSNNKKSNLIEINSQIELKYKSDDHFDLDKLKNENPEIKGDSLFAFIYTFSADANSPKAFAFKLSNSSKNKDTYITQFKLPEDVVYAYVKISLANNLRYYDDNFNNYWSLYFTKNGIVLKGGYQKNAVTLLGAVPNNCYKNINLKEAYNLLKSEIKNYPNNYEAKIGLYSLEYDTKKITNDEFNNKLKEIFVKDLTPNSEGELRALSRSYNLMNEKEKAEKLESEFISKNPKSKIAEEKLVSKLTNAKSLNEFNELALEYFKKFEKADNYQTILQAYSNSYVQLNKVDELKNIILKYNFLPKELYLTVIGEIINKPTISQNDLNLVKDLFDSVFVDTNYTQINEIFVHKPDFMNDYEWRQSKIISEAGVFELLAKYYFLNKNYKLSEFNYNKSINLVGENVNSRLLLNAILNLRYLKNTDDNELKIELLTNNYYKKAVVNSVYNDSIINDYKTFLKENFSFTDYKDITVINKEIIDLEINKYIDKLKSIAKESRLKFLNLRKLNGDNVYGSVKKLNGTYIDLSDKKDKVLLLFFTSTWCGPCQLMYPSVEKLYINYKDSSDFELITIDIWEQEKDREKAVSEMLKQIPVAFPFYIDETDLLPSRFGVNGLPTLIFVDKSGKIQYIDRGFSNDFEFQRDAIDKIEAMTNKK